MKPSARWRHRALFAPALLLAACGGIEGTGSPQAGVEGTGAVGVGTVSGFGSVFVNGVRFETGGATILMDGVPADEGALQVGMVVQVSGRLAEDALTGTASRIEFDRPLFGPLDAFDPASRRASVLELTVQLDDATMLEGLAESDLREGLACLIDGHVDAAGLLRATLVRCADDYVAGASEVEREGVVSRLEADRARFRLGGLEVNFARASLDTAAAPLADGARVEVIGVQPRHRGQLDALRVRVKNTGFKPGQQLTLEGLIGRFSSLGDFEVGGQRVDASSAQRADALAIAPAPGLRAVVTGLVRDDGVLAASRYALVAATDILFTGRVDAVDRTRESVTLFGAERHALALTQYRDRRANGRRRFRLHDLAAGDYVELRGFRDPQGRAVVTRVEQRDESAPRGGTLAARFRIILGEVDPAAALVRGPLDGSDLVRGNLVVAGVTVHTDPAQTEFYGRDGETLTGPQFYGGLRPGDRLEAEGNEVSENNVIEAVRVSYAR